MDCLFCKIISKEIEAYIVYENADAVAMLDVHPRALGHTMVLPKEHAPTLLDLAADRVGPVFQAAQTVARKLKRVLECDGLTIGINQGRASGQMVDHLHIHVIPRWHGDGGGSIHAVVNNPSRESLDVIARRLNTNS